MKKIKYNGKNILSPKCNKVFKGILGTEPNDRLVDFLNNTLNINVECKEDILICNSEIDKQKKSDETIRLDLKLTTKEGRVDVEIQVLDEENAIQNNLNYLNCLTRRSEPEGSRYEPSTTSIAVFICDYIIRNEDETYHDKFKFFGTKTGTDSNLPLIIHIIELPKFNKNSDLDDTNKWMHFLTISDETELEKVRGMDSIMSDSIDKLLHISAKEEYEVGVKEGKLEASRNVARRMKNFGYDLKFITEMIGLSAEEIKSI